MVSGVVYVCVFSSLGIMSDVLPPLRVDELPPEMVDWLVVQCEGQGFRADGEFMRRLKAARSLQVLRMTQPLVAAPAAMEDDEGDEGEGDASAAESGEGDASDVESEVESSDGGSDEGDEAPLGTRKNPCAMIPEELHFVKKVIGVACSTSKELLWLAELRDDIGSPVVYALCNLRELRDYDGYKELVAHCVKFQAGRTKAWLWAQAAMPCSLCNERSRHVNFWSLNQKLNEPECKRCESFGKKVAAAAAAAAEGGGAEGE